MCHHICQGLAWRGQRGAIEQELSSVIVCDRVMSCLFGSSHLWEPYANFHTVQAVTAEQQKGNSPDE